MKGKKFNLNDRNIIEQLLNDNVSINNISKELLCHRTSIIREIERNSISQIIPKYGRADNNCIHRMNCKVTNLCSGCYKK